MPSQKRRASRRKQNPGLGPVYKFVRTCSSDTFGAANGTSSASATINIANGQFLTCTTPAFAGTSLYGLGIAFRLSDLPGVSEFTSLYDMYRVVKLHYRLIPLWSTAVSPSSSPNGTLAGFVHSVYDYDDNTAPAASSAGVSSMMERATYQVVPAVKTSSTDWEVVPRIAKAAYASSAFTSYANEPACWIDCSSSNVEHYGLKLLIELTNPASASCFMDFRLHCTAEVEFRQAR